MHIYFCLLSLYCVQPPLFEDSGVWLLWKLMWPTSYLSGCFWAAAPHAPEPGWELEWPGRQCSWGLQA